MRVLLVGEAWGKNENDYKHAFVGTSGQELARMGGEAQLWPPLTRECRHCKSPTTFGHCSFCGTYNGVSFLEMVHFWTKTRNTGAALTNVFEAHPERDNIELFFGNKLDDINLEFGPYKRGAKNFYVLNQYSHHIKRLWEEIEQMRPNLIIPLGNTACWAILGQTKISDLRGTVHQTKWSIKALPTYHPAALRDWALRPLIVSDLTKANKESQTTTITRNKVWIETNPTLEDIEKWFSVPAQRYTCDIESGFVLYSKAELTRMKIYAPKGRIILAQLISMVGFARSGDQGLVIPFMTRNKENGQLENYWPTPEHEVLAWKWVQHGLSSGAELVFQNGLYDINRLLCSGMRPKNMKHDTMLLHHALFPEMLKGLGFLNSIYGDVGDFGWKTMYGKGESLKRDD